MSMVVAVPADVADSMLADDLALEPVSARAEPQLVTASLEAVGAVANLVAIIVAGPQLRELLSRTLKWASNRPNAAARGGASQALRIKLHSGEVTEIGPDATEAEISAAADMIAELSARKTETK